MALRKYQCAPQYDIDAGKHLNFRVAMAVKQMRATGAKAAEKERKMWRESGF